MPQLKKLNGWKTASDFEGGVFLILKGVFVKLVFADNFGIFVDGVYAQLSAQTPANAVTACYLYSAQIYCDFYGYTLIALGSARLLGIELINNFEHPYLAQSIQDFWKRWHISLTNWLRDYIFFSLGSVRKPWARYRNVLVTMLVCGVWHGAGLRFVLWGGVHGLAMVGNRLYESSARPYLSRIAPTLRRTARPLGTLMTFHFVTAAWVVFRAPNLTQASAMFAKIGQVFRFPFSPASPYGIFYWRLFAVFVAFELLDYTFDLRRAFQRSPAVLKAAWIILWFCSLYVSPLKTIKFVYYQF